MGSSSSFYQETNPTPDAMQSLSVTLAAAQAASTSALASATAAAASVAGIPSSITSSMLAFIATLPTSDPHTSGSPWWNGESFSISQG